MTMTDTETEPRKRSRKKAEPKPERVMSDEHKAALAEGREHGRIVRRYLEAMEAHRPKRGRKRNPATIEARLAYIEDNLPDADPLSRVQLIQERYDLEAQLANMDDTFDLSDLEAEFIDVAAAYSERKGLTYTAWREVGIEPRVLKAAGISR